ncbi:unnamed protein product [Polarella glacialis]|uniref:Uncharacterized protein n=1 Tax=Polarella glacialis TaxID=89957 RepID=A0A813FGU1_POLGL|nr:unnamed protein product [Polarella glacialis]
MASLWEFAGRHPFSPSAVLLRAPSRVTRPETRLITTTTNKEPKGTARIACAFQLFGLGWIIAFFAWEPDPQAIRGVATQRTVNYRFLTLCLNGGPCAISFWEFGDL